jgi:hypothetical protein
LLPSLSSVRNLFSVISAAFCLLLLIPGCSTLEFNNFQAERAENLARNRELAAHLESRAIPRDDRFHFSIGVARVHDRASGDAVGWSFTLRLRHALPFIVRDHKAEIPATALPAGAGTAGELRTGR